VFRPPGAGTGDERLAEIDAIWRDSDTPFCGPRRNVDGEQPIGTADIEEVPGAVDRLDKRRPLRHPAGAATAKP